MDLTNYIQPELLILIPFLGIVGKGMKMAYHIQDKHIPKILGVFGMILAALWITSQQHPFENDINWLNIAFTSIVQGGLCAAGAVYLHQLKKQGKKKEFYYDFAKALTKKGDGR